MARTNAGLVLRRREFRQVRPVVWLASIGLVVSVLLTAAVTLRRHREAMRYVARRRDQLEAEGIEFLLNAQTTGVVKTGKGVELTIDGRNVSGSHLLLAIAYSRAGIVDAMNSELEALARENPDSPTVAALAARLRAPRP